MREPRHDPSSGCRASGGRAPRPSIRTPLALLPLTFLACDPSPTEASRLATVTVNASDVTATRIHPESTLPQYQVTVVTSIRNTSTGPLYLSACDTLPTPIYGVELLRPRDPEGSAFDVGWACPAGAPIVLPAGAVRTDSITLRAPRGVQHGRPLGVVDGTVRIVFEAATCWTEDECARAPVRSGRLASPPVTIRRP